MVKTEFEMLAQIAWYIFSKARDNQRYGTNLDGVKMIAFITLVLVAFAPTYTEGNFNQTFLLSSLLFLSLFF